MIHPIDPIDTERTTTGQLFAVGGGLFVCRYPLSTALPVPLAVRAEDSPELVTWAFTGLGPGADPCCLLVLAYPEGSAAREPITVETHFHDLRVANPPARSIADLGPAEREALCGAVLEAASPRTLPAVARLVPVLAGDATGLPVGPDAPDLTLATDRDATARLTGLAVPNYLVLRAGDAWSCGRIVSARQRFGRRPHADLTLEPAWGAPIGARPDRALLLGTASAMPAKVAS